MFSLNLTEKQTNRVEIKDFSSAVIRTAVATMYAGYLNQYPLKDYKHMLEVARFGDKYGMEKLVRACCRNLYLQTNVLNVVDILVDVYNANFELKGLRENLIRFVVT
jgi:hypothetical protein